MAISRPSTSSTYMRDKMDKDADPSVPIKMLRAREEKAEAARMAWMKDAMIKCFEQERPELGAEEEDM